MGFQGNCKKCGVKEHPAALCPEGGKGGPKGGRSVNSAEAESVPQPSINLTTPGGGSDQPTQAAQGGNNGWEINTPTQDDWQGYDQTQSNSQWDPYSAYNVGWGNQYNNWQEQWETTGQAMLVSSPGKI